MSPQAKTDPTGVTELPSVVSGTDSTVGVAPAAPTLEDRPRFAPPAGAGELGRLGKYRIQKELGRGGMGAVYLAFDERLERQVALKVMLPRAAANPTAKDRFLREARSAARVSSDHVVSIHEADEIDGVPYIALQFLQGYPLDEYLKRKGNPTLPQAIRIAREAALGLAAAHKLGLVHRDIKPGNLWLEAPGGRVKVLDFGLAKPVNGKDLAELTASGAVVGTPSYMAPEQGMGKAVDGRADLFSLGCVLYRLVTGRLPFERPTLMAILTAIATEEPRPVRELNPTVPEPLAELIHRLMAKKPEQRPASAKEVADELDRIAHPPKPAVSHDAPTVTPQVVYVPINVSVEQPNPFENLHDDTSDEFDPPTPAPRSVAKRSWQLPVLAVGGGLLTLLMIAAAGFIVIKIINKDGTVTEVKVPDGATVEVQKNGNPVVTVNPDGKLTPPNPAHVPVDGATVKATTPTGPGLVFDGKTSHVEVPKFKLQKKAAYTVEAVVVEADKQAGGEGVLAFIADQDQTIWLTRRGKSLIGIYWPVGEQEYHVGAVVPPRTDGRPMHIALTWDGTALGLFLDGNSPPNPDSGRGATEGWAAPTVPRMILGASASGPDAQPVFHNPFAGQVCGVRISKRVRYQSAFQPPVRFDADKDTLALYHCDDGNGDVLTDSSGNKHHGKITGGKWLAAAAGLPAGKFGLRFEPSDRAVAVKVPVRPTTVVTVEAWVTFESVQESGGREFIHTPNGDVATSDGRLRVYSFHGHADAADPVPKGRRVHVAAVNDGKKRYLYQDGKRVAESDDAGGPVPENEVLAAGDKFKSIVLGSDLCTGTIDAVRVSSVARYDKEFTPPAEFKKDADTFALYLFDEGKGDELKDSSGNGYHAKISGAKWVRGEAGTADRKVAEWVLSLKGKCIVQVNDANTVCTAPEQLPAGEFKLIDVNIANEHSTDANAARFAGLKHLAFLTLFGGEVTDRGVAKLRDLPRLDYLNLDGTKVTDAGLPGLKELPELKVLILANTQVTDAGLPALKGLPKLEAVILENTAVTDEGLLLLRAAPGLTLVKVPRTKVTEAGAKKLAAALPKCKIEYDGGTIEPK